MAGDTVDGWNGNRSQQQQKEQYSSSSDGSASRADAHLASLAPRTNTGMPPGGGGAAGDSAMGSSSAVTSPAHHAISSKDETHSCTRGEPDSSKTLSDESGSQSTERDQAASPSVSESQDEGDGDDPTKKGSKKDRSKLRKGKWTVEEEEFTSRIIQHFSTGLLMLPEGATLRSYLAEKLNCDPMRITKKFTGACCLGRRVYHLRDRPQPTHAEVAMAKAELSHLEQRFRLRVEHDHSGLPLARKQEILSIAQPNINGMGPLYPLQAPSSQAAAPLSLLQNYAALSAGKPHQGLSLNLGGIPSLAPAVAPAPCPVTFVPAPAGQWLLPNTIDRSLSAVPPPVQQDPSLQLLNNAVKNWAWAQAAASLTPALSQLAASNLQQEQLKLRLAFEEQLRASAAAEISTPLEIPTAAHSSVSNLSAAAAAAATEDSPAKQLAKSYQAHLESLRKELPDGQGSETEASLSMQTSPSGMVANQTMPSMAHRNLPHSSNQVLPKQIDSIALQQEMLRLALANATQAMQDSLPVGAREQLESSIKGADQASKQTPHGSVHESVPSHTTSANRAQQAVSSNIVQHSQELTVKSLPINPKVRITQNGNPSAASQVHSASRNSAVQIENESRAPQPPNSGGETLVEVKEDEEAATSLLGLLNSLRQSYEDAIGAKSDNPSTTTEADLESGKKKRRNSSSGKVPIVKKAPAAEVSIVEGSLEEDRSSKRFHQRNPRRKTGRSLPGSSQLHPPALPTTVSTGRSRPASVTDTSTLSRSETSSGTSSQPNESSVDDSDSKTDPSSSEESSDKDYPIPQRSQGPPRKRHKARRQVQEFTTENVQQHSERMEQELDRSNKTGAY